MHASPARQVIAPSSSVIRYLRAQNKSASFFTQNHAPKDCLYRHRRERPLAPSSIAPQSRRHATSAALPLESSLGTFLQSWWSSKAGSFARPTRPASSPTSNQLQPSTQYHSRPYARSQSTIHTGERERNKERASKLAKFWSRHMRPRTPLEPNDLPERSGFLDDGLGRPLRPANELKLRCTEFDENGNVVLVNGEFRKTELIAKVIQGDHLFERKHVLTQFRSTVFSLEISAKSTPPSSPPSSSVLPQSS